MGSLVTSLEDRETFRKGQWRSSQPESLDGLGGFFASEVTHGIHHGGMNRLGCKYQTSTFIHGASIADQQSYAFKEFRRPIATRSSSKRQHHVRINSGAGAGRQEAARYV